MKKTRKFVAIAAALTLSATCALAACGPNGITGNLTDEPLTGEFVADFTKGASDAVFESDGWTNGDVFNVVWTKENVQYGADAMKLGITQEDRTAWVDNAEKTYPYTAGEARTALHYGYGDYEVSMKPAKKAGTASTFFTCTGPYDTGLDGNPQKHDEIDIEFLGKDTTKVQFNYFVNGKGGHEYMYNLGFDASEAFHTYGYRWTQDYIVWFVDGAPVYKVEASAKTVLPSAPGRMMMNYWCGNKDAENWMGKYSGPDGEAAEYQWIKSTATGVDLTPAPDEPGEGFTGDWTTIAESDVTFTASNTKYTVTKQDGVTNITYTDVAGNEYINVNAPIATAATEKNWLHLTLTNNAETDVQVRVNVIDDALANAEKNKSTNVAAYMDGTSVLTDLEWGGSFFNIPAKTTVEAEVNFGGTPESLELMIDSSRNDATVRAGDISVCAVKFAKQGEIGEVEPGPDLPSEHPQSGDLTLEVNGIEFTFAGNVADGYGANANDTDKTLEVKYTAIAGASYKNIWAAASAIAREHNVLSVKLTNKGTETATIRIDIESETNKGNTTACNLSATQDGEGVYTDLEWGGSTFTVAAGATVVAKVTYDTAAKPTNVKFFFDSSVYNDESVHSGEIVLSEIAFEGEGSVGGETPDVPPMSEGAELRFESNEIYTVNPSAQNAKSVDVTYSAVGGQTYRNIVAYIANLASGKNTFRMTIKNSGAESVRVRVDLQGATKVENTDACNVNAWAEGHGEVYTDTMWGGSFITVAAGEEVTIVITFDGEGVHGAVQNLLIYLDSSTDSADTHSGNVTLGNFIFTSEEN